MTDLPVRVLLAEGGTREASISLRTFSGPAGRCEQMYLMSESTSLLEALQKHRPDIALLQMSVLQPDPPGTVRNLHERVPDVALILWADAADKEIAVKCIHAGATDYLVEGFMDKRTVDRVLRTAITAKAAVRTPEKAQESGAIGARHAVHAAGGHLGEQTGLTGSAVRICVEVRNFRMVRKRDGRLVAEELLQRIAQTLRKGVRASDAVALNAAGEFVITLQDTVATSLPVLRRRIAARLFPFQQSSGLSTALIFRIDGEANPGSVLAGSREFRETAALPETPEPSTPAGS